MITSQPTRTVRGNGGAMRVPPAGRSLADRFPDVAAEWDHHSNGVTTPEMIAPGSDRYANWVCAKDRNHRWSARICKRSAGKGCPFCANQQVSATNNLAARFPDIATEWDYDANDGVTPEQVMAGSRRKIGWVCAADPSHRWVATANSRTSRYQSGCPKCARLQFPPPTGKFTVKKSLKVRFPDIAAEWDQDANDGMTPDRVSYGSGKKYHWVCKFNPDHRWVASVNSRTGRGRARCPKCAALAQRGPRLTEAGKSPEKSLAYRRPDLAAEWDAEANGVVTPHNVGIGSSFRAGWVCGDDGRHRWSSMVGRRVAGKGCPFCAGQRVSATNNLAARFPDIAAEWDYAANGDLTPERAMPGSLRKIAWICSTNPGHRWVAPANSRTSSYKSGCPMCSGRQVSSTNNLAARFPELAAQWDYDANQDLTPDQVVAGSNRRVAWVCPNGPDHRWVSTVASRTSTHKSRCPMCSGRRVSIGNNLAARYPELAAQWDYDVNHGLTPDQVVAGTHRQVAWVCTTNSDHRWVASPYSRVRGGKCPLCRPNPCKNVPAFGD